jgi:alpha-amylase/alpha-mannosidase (GH57 family)
MPNLAWGNLINFYQPPNCDRAELEQIVNKSYLPLLRIFAQNPEFKFSVNLPGSTVELLIRTGFGQMIKKLNELAERGQVDFTMTPKYQPVLPFLSDDDIDRQIEAGNKICRRYFGINYAPRGLYSPYMVYSQAVAKATARFGLKWVVTDEISFGNGSRGGFSSLFMDKAAGGVILFPRHRELSDQLEGNLWARKIPKSASEFTQMASQKSANDKYLITVVSAHYFGYLHNGRAGLLKALYTENKLKHMTLTDLRSYIKRKEFVKPVEASAETRPQDLKRKKPYLLWQNEHNVVQQTLWQLFNLAAAEIKNAGAKGDPQYNRAREMFDSASAGVNWQMASGNPNWESAYPQAAADDLALAVFILMTSPLKSKETAIAQRQKIYETIEHLEKSGEVKKWQKNFLRGNNIPFERYFGQQRDGDKPEKSQEKPPEK